MWHDADDALLRCLALAHESFLARGLPVGSVIVSPGGARLSEGRNRAYDPAGGADRLQRTPIAHAEMNALAAIATGTDLGEVTLWSSHRPCLMCAAACEFTGVGHVVFIAPDPSDDGDDDDHGEDPDGIETEWIVVANLLFLSGVAAYRGPSSPAILRASQREPEVTGLMRAIGDEALRRPALLDCLAPVWPAVRAAAKERRERHSRGAGAGTGEADPFDLQRFVTAQDAGGTYDRAVAELRAGRKASHWMWFVFPQIAGLGYSPTARAYAITSLAEARAYLAHPVLGPRLAEDAAILASLHGRTAEQIFGEVDALKLCSSLTLFMHAAPGEPAFRQVLDQYFDGIPDPATEQRI
jgi:uncharacterized protein (DUF1810 family)/tRNA(Arg) A34 adenosine deaminase TadA